MYPSKTLLAPWSVLGIAWQNHFATRSLCRYLLDLDDLAPFTFQCKCCMNIDTTSGTLHAVRSAGHHQEIESLVVNLSTQYKAFKDELNHIISTATPVSPEAIRGIISTCIISIQILALCSGIDAVKTAPVEETLQQSCQAVVRLLDDGTGRSHILEAALETLQPYLPTYRELMLDQSGETSGLVKFLKSISGCLCRGRHNPQSNQADLNTDYMDIDSTFDSQQSRKRTSTSAQNMPRDNLSLSMSPLAFNAAVSAQLKLVCSISVEIDHRTNVPADFIDYTLSLSDNDLLLSQPMLQELLDSDLVITAEDSVKLVEHLGQNVMGDYQLERSEVAQSLCIIILTALAGIWPHSSSGDLHGYADQIYQWFIERALGAGVASPRVQVAMATLLQRLLRVKPAYGEHIQSLPSARSSLLNILQQGNVRVAFEVGVQLADIFSLYVLKQHDTIFNDVLAILPSDPGSNEGIAVRLLLLTDMASKWPTLLRRSVYAIFETSGKLTASVRHATRCLRKLSLLLHLDSPRALFRLFSTQLLYTWLETESVDKIPAQIFGYTDLEETLKDVSQEVTALYIMRGGEAAVDALAEQLNIPFELLLRQSFTKAMAYSVCRDISVPGPREASDYVSGEARIRKRLGKEVFLECINSNLADIMTLLFTLMDPDEKLEQSLAQNPDHDFKYAAVAMHDMEKISPSKGFLPPNQQPAFRGRFLPAEIVHVSGKIRQELRHLWTPAMVVFIARNLFDTIHPALGSLHACTVLRKLRALVAISRPTSLEGYPLEMLLHSLRPFLTDSECAEDAIGITQYLLVHGTAYLAQTPSFLAGTSLSILSAMRTFLQSTQASTTQESQHRAIMSKAQKFHAWFADYLKQFQFVPELENLQIAFRRMMTAAINIRTVGNSELGSSESDLLLELMRDEKGNGPLLERPARELAFALLCTDFQRASSFRVDIMSNDLRAVRYAATVWEFARQRSTGHQYLSWAARVIGRAFATTGHVQAELLQESNVQRSKVRQVEDLPRVSESYMCILNSLHTFVCSNESKEVSACESSFRIMATRLDQDRNSLALAQAFNHLSGTLYQASLWSPYCIPPTDENRDSSGDDGIGERSPFSNDAISRITWVQDMTLALIELVPMDPVLRALPTMIRTASEFARKTFSSILHLVLSAHFQRKNSVKEDISRAMRAWLEAENTQTKNNVKLLLDTLLYLRCQPLPHEGSQADRVHWLDVNYAQAASAAMKCGMPKTALLFTEIYMSESSRMSSQSSAVKNMEQTELLLSVFRTVDDPDSFYGVEQRASLHSILNRLEYEKDGIKSLAFRGAQYDCNIRMQSNEAVSDIEPLVNALGILSLDGLSRSLSKGEPLVEMSNDSLTNMFKTARKLEQWDLHMPASFNNNSATIYKAFQTISSATDLGTIALTVDAGLHNVMSSLVQDDLSASAVHFALQSLAILTELDETFDTTSSEQFEETLARFQTRSAWMTTGRYVVIEERNEFGILIAPVLRTSAICCHAGRH